MKKCKGMRRSLMCKYCKRRDSKAKTILPKFTGWVYKRIVMGKWFYRWRHKILCFFGCHKYIYDDHGMFYMRQCSHCQKSEWGTIENGNRFTKLNE